MNSTTVVDMRQFVAVRDGLLFTTSQNVADAFGKLHKDVLRKIDSLECSSEFTERNFTLSGYVDGSGRRLPQWDMTKDGFMFLVMGFTGKKAAAIKEGYIAAFNEMAMLLGKSAQGIVGEVVAKALGKEGALILSNVMRCRVAKLGSDHQRSATAKLASALHARFNVPRIELIPADQMDSACNFIAAYAIEGEYLPKQEGTQVTGNPLSRYLVSFNYKGEQQVREIPKDACVMTYEEMLRELVAPNGLPVSTEEMFGFVVAAMANLKARSEYQTRRVAA